MTSSGENRLMEEQKYQALCAASDQSLDFLSYMGTCIRNFSLFSEKFKTIYDYEFKHMEKADLEKHFLLLHIKPGFPR